MRRLCTEVRLTFYMLWWGVLNALSNERKDDRG